MDILDVDHSLELACIVIGVIFLVVLVICVVVDSRGE